jgi:hypothetical protein
MKDKKMITPSHITLKKMLYSGFVIVQSITVAGAALVFHQLPSYIAMVQ